jgi:molecular chaperone GrpE
VEVKKEEKKKKEIKIESSDSEVEEAESKEENEEDSSKELTLTKETEEKEKPTEVEILKERLKKSEKECNDLEDKLLRLAAEFDNFKKRTIKEFDNLIKFANQDLILKITDSLDNFERALDSAKNSTDFDSFHKGVELIHTHLKEILTREGLEEIKTVGEKFDPNLHEAVSQVESDEYPEGIIVQEISKGYILKDRVIKAPKVVVSRGKGEKGEKREKRDSGNDKDTE